jgi:hypothetical protein
LVFDFIWGYTDAFTSRFDDGFIFEFAVLGCLRGAASQ